MLQLLGLIFCGTFGLYIYARHRKRLAILDELDGLAEQIRAATMSEEVYDLSKRQYELINELRNI